MQFHFQLEGLLRVRRLLENQARERLDESMMRIRSFEQRVEQATEWRKNTAEICASQKVIPAAELQFVDSVLRRAKEAIVQCQLQKQLEEQRAAEYRARYLLARRGRKTVETLRENALRLFLAEQARREQATLDDNFLGKMLYSRNIERATASESDPELNP